MARERYTVTISDDYHALGTDARQADLEGYAYNLAGKLCADFGVTITVQWELTNAVRVTGPDESIADDIRHAVNDIQQGDAWTDLLPEPRY